MSVFEGSEWMTNAPKWSRAKYKWVSQNCLDFSVLKFLKNGFHMDGKILRDTRKQGTKSY